MPTVIPGKLKLKGVSSTSDKKKKKKKRNREESDRDRDHEDPKVEEITTGASSSNTNSDAFLTESQRKFEQKRRKTDLQKAKHITQTTYRERVEKFNYDLSIMSEHNDIPRVSAAGNG